MNEAKKQRDMRLRRRALVALFGAQTEAPRRCLSGRSLRETIDSGIARDQRTEHDRHALSLFLELVVWGLITERDARKNRDDEADLDHLEYAISGKGLLLLNESIEPHPGVDDVRRIED